MGSETFSSVESTLTCPTQYGNAVMNLTDHVLRLYITGSSDRSDRAIRNWKQFCEQELGPLNCKLEIIDVLEDPEAAEEAKIFATPTLIKHFPPPPRRIIGDVVEKDQVMRTLNIQL